MFKSHKMDKTNNNIKFQSIPYLKLYLGTCFSNAFHLITLNLLKIFQK